MFDFVKEDGNIFLNADDKILRNQIKIRKNALTFGSNKNVDVNYNILGITNDSKYKIKIEGFNKSLTLTIPLLGKANVQNLITAITVCLKLGLSKNDIINSIKTLQPVKGDCSSLITKILQ